MDVNNKYKNSIKHFEKAIDKLPEEQLEAREQIELGIKLINELFEDVITHEILTLFMMSIMGLKSIENVHKTRKRVAIKKLDPLKERLIYFRNLGIQELSISNEEDIMALYKRFNLEYGN